MNIGDWGHLSVIVAFAAAMVAALGYFMAARQRPLGEADESWLRLGRTAFIVHGLAVVGVIVALFGIIHGHRYEYYYAWSHSSNHLPVYYMISCFWEGQEGSFLLWIFWHVVLGAFIIRGSRQWEAPVMAVFAFVQLFLVSMILGVVIGSLKLGSSPFILMREFMPDLPVYKLNPDWVPEDGKGLNALLQNYWMVIHPPTLFLGFALTLVPFAYAIAGLWKGELTKWVQPAIRWSLVGGGVLGVGVMMGAYWAYETLNFGGYWNWDPVENAVYIPWLVLVAALHALVLWQRGRTGLRTAYSLVIATFLLILYATFLTRSGVLGNASVHSFTDLGLSGQLLLYLGAFVVLSVAMLVWRWKQIPVSEKELTMYNAELWVFIGATVLCLGAFQVLVTTSIPVYNALMGLFGVKTNVALPADQIAHYTKIQLWMGVFVALFSGIAQLLWWQKNSKETISNTLTIPTILTLLFASLFILLVRNNGLPMSLPFIAVLTTGLFGVLANLSMLLQLIRRGVRISGGAVSHIGIALMLLGILASAGYSNIISKNTSGLLYSREFPDDLNRDNVLLWRNQAAEMGPYKLTYTGQFYDVPGVPGYVNKELLFRTADEYKALARADIKQEDGKTYYKAGDTLEIRPEDTYYRVEYKHKESGKQFVLYPRAQVNQEMGGLLASPDIKLFWDHDIYSHVSSVPDPSKEKDWSEVKEYTVSMGDTLILNDYVAVFKEAEPATNLAGLGLSKDDIAVQADLIVSGEGGKQYHAHPIFVVKDRLVGRVPDEIEALGLRISFNNLDPTSGKFTFGVSTTQKDYVILKAMEKPFINLLWSGTLLMGLGFGMAVWQRGRKPRPAPATKVPRTSKAPQVA
ncbi:cytochrome C biogenesis protein [Hymenobacter busanensis]|uniref:Cytochrome C biogenesis protein n=1 Tax=Hymenobacter busanensis TaxID=2607656 RepID=A0A7L4ZWX2_9BACT|nr:cytochrome c biogenesis protein CcsA [Hymenobacter busanensis]KAA9325279.1 cytochrome C biogenesis protein [Hymenobacter busanensis]QHJ07728.1 cytochrome C biogenesis protein [Hymenobacter busanensis]